MQNKFKISDWVLENNNQFIVLNKPSGVPVQQDKTQDISLDLLVKTYCKHPVFLINRIDRPASGLVVFGKKKSYVDHLYKQFEVRETAKYYLAITEKGDIPKADSLTHWIAKQKTGNKSIIVDKPNDNHQNIKCQEAILNYQIVEDIDRYFLIYIELVTGRHHQIRAQLAHIGCPIQGDVKYGARRGNKDRSLPLHAFRLSLNHPISNQRYELEAKPPEQNFWKHFNLKNLALVDL